MPTLRERIAGFRHGRAATESIPFHPSFGQPFLGGLGDQPSTGVLLKESRGVAAAATRAIANRVSTLNPLVKVSRRQTEGTLKDETLDDHPLKLLLDKPHPNFTRSQIFGLLASHVLTVGEGYWLKVGSRLGVPIELHPIPPANVTPILASGVVEAYRVTDGEGHPQTLPADTIVRFYIPDPESPWSAEGYLGPAGIVTDSLKFAGQHLKSHYQNDATPKTALQPGEASVGFSPDEAKRFGKQWTQRHHRISGSDQSSPAIIPTNYTLIELAMQSGADIVPLLEHWTDEQLMGFFTPKSIMGKVVSGDRSSAETNQWVFDRYAVLPIATLITDAITLQLAPDFDPRIFSQFEPFVSEDKDFELRRDESDHKNKIRSPQQILRDRNADPEDAPWGEFPVGTLAESPYTGEAFTFEPDVSGAIEDEGEAVDLDPEDEDDRSRRRLNRAEWFSPDAEWERQIHREKKYVPVILRQMRTIFTAQEESIIGRLEAIDADRTRIVGPEIFDPGEWEHLFRVRIDPLREAAFREILGETLAGLGIDEFVFTDEMRRFLKTEGARLVKQTGVTTQRRISEALQVSAAEGEGLSQQTARIRQVFNERRKNHARTIARTETLKASQNAQLTGFETSGVVEKKRWNTARDNAVRDSHVATEGQTVGVREAFLLGDGEPADAPGIGGGGGQLSAENTINCRCFITPVVED